MSTIVDELITKFTLEGNTWQSGGAKVTAAAKSVTDHITAAAFAVDDFGKKIAAGFGLNGLLAPLAALGTATGLVELGKHALEVTSQFDVLERKLIGVTGTVQKAREIMSFSEKESGNTGLFDVEALDRAAVKLEGFGLSAQRYLPMLEGFVSIFGDGTEAIDEMAIALGRLDEGGNSGRILTMLARFGVGKNDLMAHGVQFAGLQLASRPEVVLNAIQQISQEPKFQGVRAEMENSPEARSMKAANIMELAWRQAGTAIQSAYLPAIDKIGKVIDKWVEGGQITKMVNSFMELFGLDSGHLEGTLDPISNWLSDLPNKVAQAFTSFKTIAENVFGAIVTSLSVIAEVWAGMWAFQAVVTGWDAITKAMKAAAAAEGVVATIGAFIAGLAGGWAKLLTGLAAGAVAAGLVAALIGHARSEISDIFHGARSDANAAEGGLMPGNPPALPGVGATNGQPELAGMEAQGLQHLRNIDENMKQAAIDLRRYALGGGDIGRVGVTPVEMAALRGAHGAAASGLKKIIDGVIEYTGAVAAGKQIQAARQAG